MTREIQVDNILSEFKDNLTRETYETIHDTMLHSVSYTCDALVVRLLREFAEGRPVGRWLDPDREHWREGVASGNTQRDREVSLLTCIAVIANT